MAVIWDLIEPAELTAFVREAANAHEDNASESLAPFIPNDQDDRIEYLYQTQPDRLYEAAKFRAWDSSAPIISRSTNFTRTRGKLPPISVKSVITELEAVLMEGAEQDIIDAVFADAAYLGQAIAERFELQRGEALDTDGVVISENGLILPALDFGRSAGNDKTPAALWDITTTDILGDLKAWQKAHPLVEMWMTSTDVWDNMLAADQFRDIIRGDTAATSTALVSNVELNNVLGRFGVKPFVFYDRQLTTTDDDGLNRTTARVTPANRLYGLPNAPIGNVMYGVTQEARDLNFAVSERPGIVAASMTDFDTVQKWTKASAVGLTVLGRSDDVVTATVIT